MEYREPKLRKRGNRWQIDYVNPSGIRRQLKAGSNRKYAENLKLKFTSWLLEGKDPEIEIRKQNTRFKLSKNTIKDFFPLFMERHGANRSHKMQESYHSSFKNVCRCKQLSDIPMSEIDQALIIDYMNARMKFDNVKPATVNREKAFLSIMLTKAVIWGYLERNPLAGMENLKENKKRNVGLSPEQAAKLIDTLPTREMKAIVSFAIYSGFRLEEILNLKIENVVWSSNGLGTVVTIVDKGGDRVRKVISEQATKIIRDMSGDREEGYVFLNSKTGIRYKRRMNSFDNAVQKLGLKAHDGSKLRFHDLRHVYGNWLHQAGVSLDELRVLYGHKDRSTTDRYVTPNLLSVAAKLSLQPCIGIVKEEK